MATANPTPAELRAAFSYDPSTGQIRRINGERPGPVGHMASGYLRVVLGDRQMMAHRVAWCLVHGEWPLHQIDHINGDKADNRLANLRDVTGLVNSQNMHRAKKNNRAGELGVSRYKSGRHIARIYREGRRYYLGSFGTAEEARAAYRAAKESPTALSAM